MRRDGSPSSARRRRGLDHARVAGDGRVLDDRARPRRSSPRRAAIARAAARKSSTTCSRAARSESRTSTSSSTSPGTTLIAPGRTRSTPTVPTVVPLGDARAIRSSAIIASAAPASASRRRRIGVAPACVAAPRSVSRKSCGAAIAVTTPIGSPPPRARALLDVQLDERVDAGGVDPRVGQPVGVEARVAQRVGHAHAVAVAQPVEVGAREIAGGRAAADAAGPEPRLLPRPGDDLDRPPRGGAALPQEPDGLDRAEHPEHAVVAAGVQRRVDVGAGEDERRAGLAPRPAAEQVADRVDAGLQAGLAHPARDAVERAGVRRRVHLARDPARAGIVVELGELGDRVVQPGGHRRHCNSRSADGRRAPERSPARLHISGHMPLMCRRGA